MLEIALIGDSHFDQHSRFEECIRVHEWIVADAARRGVKAFLHGGDVYERKSTPRERDAVARFVQSAAEVGPVAIVRGNHDALEDLPLLERLETKNAVFVCERATTLRLATSAGDIALALLGWPQRAHVHQLVPDASHDAVELAAHDALRAVLRGMGDWLEQQDCPRLFLGHVMMRGSRVSTGQPLVGCDFELGLEDLALARAQFYGLAHVHMGNEWDIAGAPAVYPGGPRRTAFGEVEEKGYVIIRFDGSRLVGWERIATPATPMVQLDFTWVGEGNFFLDCGRQPNADELTVLALGAEVRLRYHVDADQQDAARPAAEELAELMRRGGAVFVKVEPVVEARTRARTLAVAQAQTLAQKLEALWTVQKFEPGDRRDELLAKANQVESESLHAA